MVCVHAENHGMITWMGKRLLAGGYRAPRYHVPSHPRLGEVEAIGRAIACAALVDQPLMIFHVSTAEGAGVIHRARGEGRKVWGETCTQYLTLGAHDLDRPGLDGAMWMCSPPLREPVRSGSAVVGAGDRHAAGRLLRPRALPHGRRAVSSPRAQDAHFKEIANGMPGLELRLPVLFDAMVSRGRLGLEKFVELTATAPARLYGLARAQGQHCGRCGRRHRASGIPERVVEIAQGPRHDSAGYTPYAGRTLRGWPETVLRRGQVIVAAGVLQAPRLGPLPAPYRRPGRSPARSAGAGAGPGAQFRRRAGAPI